jgi:hypothetical protein
MMKMILSLAGHLMAKRYLLAALEMASTIRKSVMNADSIDQTGLTDNKGI